MGNSNWSQSNTWKFLTKQTLCTCRWPLQPMQRVLHAVKLTCAYSARLLHSASTVHARHTHWQHMCPYCCLHFLNSYLQHRIPRALVWEITSTYFLHKAEFGSSAVLYHRRIEQTCPVLRHTSVHSQSAAKPDKLTIICILNRKPRVRGTEANLKPL